MIKKLLKLADRLDRDGNSEDADLIDSIIKISNIEEKLELSDWISTNLSEKEMFEIEDEAKLLEDVMENLYSSFED